MARLKDIRKRWLWIGGGAAALLIVVVTLILTIYYAPSSRVGMWLWRYIPAPVVWVDSSTYITTTEISTLRSAIRQFYTNQDFSNVGTRVDFDSAEGQQKFQYLERRLINKLLEDKVVAKLGKAVGVSVSLEEADQAYQRRVVEMGGTMEVTQKIQTLYGFTEDQFIHYLVLPDLRYTKLAAAWERRDTANPGRAKAEAARSALSKGDDWAAVVVKYSTGPSATKSGVVGWVTTTEVTPEIAGALTVLSVGKFSDIVESDLGYHILRVDEVRTGKVDREYLVSQVFVPKVTPDEKLLGELQKTNAHVWWSRYQWDASVGEIVFANAATRATEAEFEENAPEGDVLQLGL
jgi:hypothetical protein